MYVYVHCMYVNYELRGTKVCEVQTLTKHASPFIYEFSGGEMCACLYNIELVDSISRDGRF